MALTCSSPCSKLKRMNFAALTADATAASISASPEPPSRFDSSRSDATSPASAAMASRAAWRGRLGQGAAGRDSRIDALTGEAQPGQPSDLVKAELGETVRSEVRRHHATRRGSACMFVAVQP